MSLLVVIKGPVAMAGSILLRSKMMGTKVPISAETTITHNIDRAIVRLTDISRPVKYPNINKSALKAIPLISHFYRKPKN